jgi:hypothetical protein
MSQENHNSTRSAVKQFCSRYLLWSASLKFLSIITFWNFAFGFLILVLRQLRYEALDFLAFSLAGIPVCLLLTLIIVLKKQLPGEKALAALDSYNRAGGLLLSIAETSDKNWHNKLPAQIQIPPLQANFSKKIPVLLISVIFLLAGIKVPLIGTSRYEDPGMDLQTVAEEAVLKIETLEETETITPEEAQELKETVGKIIESADKNDPSKTFEALDQLEERLSQAAQADTQKSAAKMKEMQNLQEMAKQLQSADPSDLESLKNAAAKLKKNFSGSELAKQMAAEQKDAINKGLEAVGGSDAQTAQQLKKAAEELNSYIEKKAAEMAQNAAKMLKVKLIDQKTMQQLLKEGKIKPVTDLNDPALKDAELFMAPSNGDSQGAAASGSGQTGQGSQGQNGNGGQGQNGQGESSGSGGISKGGGTAPLNYNRKSSEHDIGYKDELLPAPQALSLEDSVVIGQGIAAPQTEATDGSNQTSQPHAIQDPARSTGQTELILPRHRNAVKNYFDRN